MKGFDKALLRSSTPTKRHTTPKPSAFATKQDLNSSDSLTMEGSDKGLRRSSTPIKRPVTPNRSASDENDQYYQQLGPRKPMMAKHYMSPTISAASKAIASRKTILGERKEGSEPNSPNTHVEKLHLSSGNDSLSQAMPLSLSDSETHVDDENGVLSDGLASRPYDPIINYLSPRPKFLRYKPNRRREIFLGLENSISERNYELSFSTSGSFDSEKGVDEGIGGATTPSSLSSPCLDGFCKQDDDVEVRDEESDGECGKSDEETGESDEESDGENEESDEEEKGWCLKGVLKSLLVLLVVVLFSSHIAPMNQQTLYEVVEDANFSIRNSSIEADLLKKLESGGNFWDQREDIHMSLVEEIREDIEMGAGEVNVVENESGGEVMGQAEQTQTDPMEEKQIVIEEGVKDEGRDEDMNLGGIEYINKLRQVLELQVEAMTEEEKKGGIGELGKVVVLQAEDIQEVTDQVIDNTELETVADEPYQNPPMSDPPMSDDVDLHNQVSDVSKTFEEEGEGLETMDSGDTDFEEVLDSEAEGNWSWREELINHMKSQTFYITVLGVSLFSLMVASLLLVFWLKQRTGVKKDSSFTAKPLVKEHKEINENVSSLPSKPDPEPVAEIDNSVIPKRGEDSIQHVYSSFRRMSSSSKHSAGAVSKEHFHNQAPSVQFLGEFVVGEVSSSSRTFNMKTKRTENEESNYSLSSKVNLGSKVHSVSIQSQPSVSEFSSMASPSDGSYTPQKVWKQTEGGKDGEVTSTQRQSNRLGNDGEATTPLRRSTRLRSRSVISP